MGIRPIRFRFAVALALVIGGVGLGWLILAMPGMDHTTPAPIEFGHIHGVAVNSADDTVVIATHTGLLALPSQGGDQPERIGKSFQDVMGIAAIGPDHFIGSGHPDVAGLRARQPPQLGLIESTDGGASWSLKSLSGKADLHAIATTGDVTYAWDAISGQLLVTRDQIDWKPLAVVDLTGLAVNPADRNNVVSAGQGGFVESTDGGHAWSRTENSPAVTLLAWTTDFGLVGIDRNGILWRRIAGLRWEEVGSLPATPVAMTADSAAMYVATQSDREDVAVLRSEDGGASWITIYSKPDD